MTNVELYEALKGSIPDKAARLIAEVFPHARDIATKTDIAGLEVRIAGLDAKIERLHASTLRWMLGLFVPVWVATAGMLYTLLLKA